LSLQLHSPVSNSSSPFLVAIEAADGPAGSAAATVGTGSAPSTTTTSPTTRQRVEAIELQRPHTVSNAVLSARGGGGSFGSAQQMPGSALAELAASPRAATAASSSSPHALADDLSPHGSDGLPFQSPALASAASASPTTPVAARLYHSASPPHVHASPPSASSASSGTGGGSGHSRHVSFPNLSPAQQRTLRGSPDRFGGGGGGSSGGGGRATPGSSASPYGSPSYAHTYAYPYPSHHPEHKRQGSSLSIVTDHSGASWSSRERERERER